MVKERKFFYVINLSFVQDLQITIYLAQTIINKKNKVKIKNNIKVNCLQIAQNVPNIF